jgi:hypothetical protein
MIGAGKVGAIGGSITRNTMISLAVRSGLLISVKLQGMFLVLVPEGMGYAIGMHKKENLNCKPRDIR